MSTKTESWSCWFEKELTEKTVILVFGQSKLFGNGTAGDLLGCKMSFWALTQNP
jgi:hypothetical protein